MTTMIDTNCIRDLNDRFRRSFTGDGRRLMTAGVAALPLADQIAICAKVMEFDAFTEDNDPHGEHDFGAFEHNGEKLFWKIDYYAPDMEHGSDDPADAAKTVRVLTIMLADEY